MEDVVVASMDLGSKVGVSGERERDMSHQLDKKPRPFALLPASHACRAARAQRHQ